MKHKVRAVPLPKDNEYYDEDYEENDVNDAAREFYCVQKLAKPEVEDERDEDGGDHDETGVPSLRRI